jgi:ABC-type molybdate transport system substrate-binding protein
MRRVSGTAVFLALLLAGAALAAADLRRQEASTLVIYTTPALKDLLEKDIIPRYQKQSGVRVEAVYVAAGEQYNRLRMSGQHPEADVFLHASPLFIEKGFRDGYFEPFDLPAADDGDPSMRSRAVEGGHIWYVFAWSPLVEVFGEGQADTPDLATSELRYGLAHPLLSNNGIYNVLFFETVDPAAGRHALERTSVQPVNARATITGIADGSFDLTLGYEAVTLLYQAKGAAIRTDLPQVHGNRSVLPVIMSAGLVRHHQHESAEDFLAFLFSNETQSRLAKSYFRSVLPGQADPKGALALSDVPRVAFDWSGWEGLESKLASYQVRS